MHPDKTLVIRFGRYGVERMTALRFGRPETFDFKHVCGKDRNGRFVARRQTNTRTIAELQQMTNVVIIVSLVIAGCSLAVSVTGGVNDRKRPFSLLRLTGVPITVLRRVVALEAAVPLLLIAVLSAGMGFLAAALFLRSQPGESLRPPGVDYYVIVVAGLVASLAIIASTLPLIERITGPEIARNE